MDKQAFTGDDLRSIAEGLDNANSGAERWAELFYGAVQADKASHSLQSQEAQPACYAHPIGLENMQAGTATRMTVACEPIDNYTVPLYPHVQSQESEPVAWAVFVGNGNIRIWSADPTGALRAEFGESLVPLYTAPTIKDSLTVQAQIPEGWKLVPTEPTEDMIVSLYGHIYEERMYPFGKGLYKAMLCAVPKPPTEGA